MTEPEQNLSRRNRKKKRNRANNILNLLIAVVVVLIITVASTIFLKGGDDNQVIEKNSSLTTEQTPEEEDGSQAAGDGDGDDDVQSDESQDGQEDFAIADEAEGEMDEQSGVITYMSPDDDVIAETLVDTSWEPIGTTQTGEHVSKYDGQSVDWEEKKQALAYATGLPVDTMEFWKIKNGGSPQHSIGIVSSADKSEKYRVYLEWIDGEGWKPVKMDVLKTLNFDY